MATNSAEQDPERTDPGPADDEGAPPELQPGAAGTRVFRRTRRRDADDRPVAEHTDRGKRVPPRRAPLFSDHTSVLPLAVVWLLTRGLMIVLLLRDNLGIGGVSREVYALYQHWYQLLADRTFPPGDVTWQYPPGAGLVILAPGAAPQLLTYFQAFVALALLADAAIAFALVRRGGSGAWLWVGGLPLLLHLPLARYDLFPTALAVFGLLALLSGRTRLGGALAGLGAMVKLWPLLILAGLPRGRPSRRGWSSALLAAGALLAVLVWGYAHVGDFAEQQGGRGLQIESLGGSALALAGLAGWWHGEVRYRYGAFELAGPYTGSAAQLALALSAVALGWLLLWRWRSWAWSPATPADAALTAVLLFTVTSRVISPQYLVWLLALAAVCLTCRDSVMRRPALLMVPAAALTSLGYPIFYEDVIALGPLGTMAVALRNAVLLAAALLACRRLWLQTVPGPPSLKGL
ncbi:glycosyltransferase 87 family protein [Streptomyces lichenis]|uniref:Glycosyltransferase 87 family protein n=1 Tax=Streptomyces lichenis TaxID=2306967 RepID=A0ABT0I602_9ACTN|nr:glycosyltransferase 87 family protein [Streptomyces lichenis]MCK8676749.1 glycosyltransferase 87 family protein [Streptomyces lichenis]